MLQEDPLLFQLYKDLVVSQVISADEFWANRLGEVNNTELALHNNKQEVGISGAFLVSASSLAHSDFAFSGVNLNFENLSIDNTLLEVNRPNFRALQADIRPQTDGCNGLRYNLTADIIESIFRTYPAGKRAHLNVEAGPLVSVLITYHFSQFLQQWLY